MYKVTIKRNQPTFKIVRVVRKVTINSTGRRGLPGAQGVPGVVQSIVAGTNVTVDSTDPANPIVSSQDDIGGQVNSVVAGAGIDVDSSDPINPQVSLNSATQTSLGLADSSIQPGDNVSDLTNDAGYITSAPVTSVNSQTGVVSLDTDDITDTATNRYTNDTDVSRLANTSGNNTGDQDLSGLQTKLLTFNQQTDSYELVISDADKMIELSDTDPITITVPENTDVPFPIGTQVHLTQTNTGQVTVVGDGAVVVNATPGLKLTTQWSVATLVKRATDTWLLFGDLTV